MARFDPGYTVADLVFYSGLMGGIIVTYLGLGFFEVELHQLLKLLIGFAVGAVLGYGMLFAYNKATERPKWPQDEDDFYGDRKDPFSKNGPSA